MDIKYEFRDGQMIPYGGWERDDKGRILGMAGTTASHSDIVCNLICSLGNQLVGTSAKLGNSDLRVHIPRTGRYTYPDVSVTCEPRVFDPPDQMLTLVNPQVVIEVLSQSTVPDDRGEKLGDYITMPTLREYVLFAQDRPRAETFYRQPDGVWAIGPWSAGLDAAVPFRSMGVTVPLAEVYAGMTFPAEGAA